MNFLATSASSAESAFELPADDADMADQHGFSQKDIVFIQKIRVNLLNPRYLRRIENCMTGGLASIGVKVHNSLWSLF